MGLAGVRARIYDNPAIDLTTMGIDGIMENVAVTASKQRLSLRRIKLIPKKKYATFKSTPISPSCGGI